MTNATELAERLREWAQNEEMINQYYTAHGRDCNAAASLLEGGDREAIDRIAHTLNTAQVRWDGDTVIAYISAIVTAAISKRAGRALAA